LKQFLVLILKEDLAIGVLILSDGGITVERAHIDLAHFWSLEDLTEGPHEGTVDPHELLLVNTVGLVEDNAHL
jgi:hypothetical protein